MNTNHVPWIEHSQLILTSGIVQGQGDPFTLKSYLFSERVLDSRVIRFDEMLLDEAYK